MTEEFIFNKALKMFENDVSLAKVMDYFKTHSFEAKNIYSWYWVVSVIKDAYSYYKEMKAKSIATFEAIANEYQAYEAISLDK